MLPSSMCGAKRISIIWKSEQRFLKNKIIIFSQLFMTLKVGSSLTIMRSFFKLISYHTYSSCN